MMRCSCPLCRYELVIHESKAGAIIPCPSCSHPFQLPTPTADSDQVAVAQLVVVTINCPHCWYAFPFNPTVLEATARCPNCAHPLRTPDYPEKDATVGQSSPSVRSPHDPPQDPEPEDDLVVGPPSNVRVEPAAEGPWEEPKRPRRTKWNRQQIPHSGGDWAWVLVKAMILVVAGAASVLAGGGSLLLISAIFDITLTTLTSIVFGVPLTLVWIYLVVRLWLHYW